jgi:hypothetical protein
MLGLSRADYQLQLPELGPDSTVAGTDYVGKASLRTEAHILRKICEWYAI